MVVVPMTVWATTGGGGGQVACELFAYSTTAASTSSTSFTDIPGLTVSGTLAEAFTVQLSANFGGTKVALQVTDTSIGGTSVLQPGVAFAANTGSSFSFTWVGSNPAEHSHTFTAQWRVVGSGTATFQRGDISLLYQGAPTPTTCT